MTKSIQTEPEIGDETWRKADFPVFARDIDGLEVIYLDSAAKSLTPVPVIDAITDYYRDVGANIHRGKHYLSEEASTQFEEARYRVAQLVGTSGNSVVFTRNTTESINLVARGLQLGRDDMVITFADSHHSNLLPWRHARVEVVRTDPNGQPDFDHYRQLLEQRPKLVALNHCSNVTGVYAPLLEMIAAAKHVGAITLVDAAQSIPHRRIKLNELGADFLAFSAHKMLGPTGIGALCATHEALSSLNPMLLGGGVVDWVDTHSHRLRKIPHCFEAGTPHIAGAIGLMAAIDYLDAIGYKRVEAHDRELGRFMLQQAKQRDYIEVLGPTDEDLGRSAMVSMRVHGCDSLDSIARMLSDSYGLMCRTGHMCAQPLVDFMTTGEILRASAYIYNFRADIEKLFSAMDEVYSYMNMRNSA